MEEEMWWEIDERKKGTIEIFKKKLVCNLFEKKRKLKYKTKKSVKWMSENRERRILIILLNF